MAKSGRLSMKIEDQIKRLKEAVGPAGVKQAEKLIKEFPADVIRLAFKQLEPAVGLGNRLEHLVGKIDAKERDRVRALLLEVKASQPVQKRKAAVA